MSASLHNLAFNGGLLERGFWLYVWEISPANSNKVLYVGMTGDSASANAQSPFNRLSQHLGFNHNANALRRHLEKAGIKPESCRSFEMIAYGPIFPHTGLNESHKSSWRVVAALEKGLRDALHRAGYIVLNDVKSLQVLDQRLLAEVLDAFSERFNKLASDSKSKAYA